LQRGLNRLLFMEDYYTHHH